MSAKGRRRAAIYSSAMNPPDFGVGVGVGCSVSYQLLSIMWTNKLAAIFSGPPCPKKWLKYQPILILMPTKGFALIFWLGDTTSNTHLILGLCSLSKMWTLEGPM